MTISSASTEAQWSERVTAWRNSGESIAVFARGKGFSDSALRYWKMRLSRPPKENGRPRIVPLVSKSQAPRARAAVAAATPSSDVVVEVGLARIRVSRGFDREVLVSVVAALGGGAA